MSKRNEKCHRERIACPMAIFLLLGILIFSMQCAFGSKWFASAEAKPLPAHGAVSSSSIPFALIVSGRRSIHTAIISTDA